MIDAYIIEKLRREKEEQDQRQWQPIPLPLEEYDHWDMPEPRKKEEEKDVPRGFVILRLSDHSVTGEHRSAQILNLC